MLIIVIIILIKIKNNVNNTLLYGVFITIYHHYAIYQVSIIFGQYFNLYLINI